MENFEDTSNFSVTTEVKVVPDRVVSKRFSRKPNKINAEMGLDKDLSMVIEDSFDFTESKDVKYKEGSIFK